jgi:phosphate-selective porin OprO and OprP
MLTELFAALVFLAPQDHRPVTVSPAFAFAEQEASAGSGRQSKKKKKSQTAESTSSSDASDADVPPPDDVSEEARARVNTPAHGTELTWKQHPGLRVGSVFRLDIQAKFQEDIHESYSGASDLDTFDLHRNRIGVQGHLFKRIEYEVERELTEKELDAGKTPKSPWKDVYVNLTYIKNAQVQVGKFKVPFGLDQLTSVTHNDFVYRSLGAAYLAPARDIGGMVHGSFLKHGLEYSTGVFSHDGDNARSSKIRGGDATFAARLTGTPFRRLGTSVGDIDVGSAVAITSVSDDSFQPNGLRGRTAMTQDVFFGPVFVKGQRRRWEADVNWKSGPASARAEYTLVSDERLAQGLGHEDLPNVRGRSWYVSGTWVLTGEEKKRPVRPRASLLQGGIGAVELAARYERLWFDSAGGGDQAFRNPRAETILPSGDHALTFGLNWTLNRFVKVQFNGIRERIDDAERSPVTNGAAFWSRAIRLQFVL